MITIREAEQRGLARLNWLHSQHTFSFGDYYDPQQMGFRALRVINEDRVAPGAGFGTHPHRDMEILSYVLEGAMEHRDSTGNGSVIRPGEVQLMAAGTGIQHSEYNASDRDPLHFLQIWITPRRLGLRPVYQQQRFALDSGRPLLLASPDGRQGSLVINQDVAVYAARLDQTESFTHLLEPERHAWLQVARGQVTLNGTTLEAGDGAAISDQRRVTVNAEEDLAEVLLFDLA